MGPFYDLDGYDGNLKQFGRRVPDGSVRAKRRTRAGFLGQEVRGSPRNTSRRCQATKERLGSWELLCG